MFLPGFPALFSAQVPRLKRRPIESNGWRLEAALLPRRRGGELLHHGQQQLAVAFIQVSRVAADLGQKAQFFVGELLQIAAACPSSRRQRNE